MASTVSMGVTLVCESVEYLTELTDAEAWGEGREAET
jgi:hypothetical protein